MLQVLTRDRCSTKENYFQHYSDLKTPRTFNINHRGKTVTMNTNPDMLAACQGLSE